MHLVRCMPRWTAFLLLLAITAPASFPALPALASVFAPSDAVTPGESPERSRSYRHQVPMTDDGQLPLVIEVARPDYDRAARRLEELGGVVLHRFEHVDGMAITIPASQLDAFMAAGIARSTRRQHYVHRAVAPLCPPELRDLAGDLLPVGADRREIEPLRSDPSGLRVESIDPGRVRTGAGNTLDHTLSDGSGISGAAAGGPGIEPTTFMGYDIVTGATEAWETAGHGEGVIVCVMDTGVYPAHPLLAGNVIGGTNLVPAEVEEAIDVDGDGLADGYSFDWDAPENHYHGTFVAGLVAGHADLLIDLATSPDSSLALSLLVHSPESVVLEDTTTVRVRLFGTAPSASIYAIKVFPFDGGATPDARVAEALDLLISMKESGELDTDVINMSMGGPVLDDGDYFLDRMIDAATAAGITVVVSAGNEGPSIMTVGSPGTAHAALTVGAATDPIHSRVGFEMAFPTIPVGAGGMLYRYEDLQVADFSSRGPTADDRVVPHIVATGFFNFSGVTVDTDGDGLRDAPSFAFGSGTSYSAPTVAGAAALVTAYGKQVGRFGRAPYVANVLTQTAVLLDDTRSLSNLAQGAGFLELTGAVDYMERGYVWHGARLSTDNQNQRSFDLPHGVARGETPLLAPGETYDFLVRIRSSVTRLEVRFPEILLGEVQNPLFGDHLTIYAHSAKRGGSGDYVFAPWMVEPGVGFVYEGPEPGTMRITLGGMFTNWGTAAGSFEVRATTETLGPDHHFWARIGRDGMRDYAIEVPEGTAAMGAVLMWDHNWSRLPTYDLDLYCEHAEMSAAAATYDSPEWLLVEEPAAGPWTFRVVDAGTIQHGAEAFRLLVKMFDAPPPPGAVARLAVGGVPASGGAIVAGAGLTPIGVPTQVVAAPNPFNPATRIRFALDAEAVVAVSVYDVSGRLVRHLFGGALEAGTHTVRWDGRTTRGPAAASGVYFAEIETAAGRVAHKLVLAE